VLESWLIVADYIRTRVKPSLNVGFSRSSTAISGGLPNFFVTTAFMLITRFLDPVDFEALQRRAPR
jgi:hypothetical protein